MRKWLFFYYWIGVCLLSSGKLRAMPETPYVLLVSLDGFRWDYPQRNLTPNLDKIRKNGVAALSLKPVYPTQTFPNHFSVITGMYPENHGIMLNDFKDPFSGRRYQIRNRNEISDSRWYWGEAFWETAEKQGITSATYFWPGSEMALPYRRATYVEQYEHKRPYKERIKGVLKWLKLPEEKRPHFITLYFHEVDSKGHRFGPMSEPVNKAIKQIDQLLGKLMAELSAIKMLSRINLIVLSDHGMSETAPERVINIEQTFLSEFKCRYENGGPLLLITPQEDQLQAVYLKLKQAEKHFKVYRKEAIPGHLHFSGHPYVTPLWIVADMGWSVYSNASAKKYGIKKVGGNHGYEPHHRDMHGIFYAMGPDFKVDYPVGTLENIDIYPLLCEIFHIYPRQNIDGQLDKISFILQ